MRVRDHAAEPEPPCGQPPMTPCLSAPIRSTLCVATLALDPGLMSQERFLPLCTPGLPHAHLRTGGGSWCMSSLAGFLTDDTYLCPLCVCVCVCVCTCTTGCPRGNKYMFEEGKGAWKGLDDVSRVDKSDLDLLTGSLVWWEVLSIQ